MEKVIEMQRTQMELDAEFVAEAAEAAAAQ